MMGYKIMSTVCYMALLSSHISHIDNYNTISLKCVSCKIITYLKNDNICLFHQINRK